MDRISLKDFVFREIMCSILLGSIPCALVVFFHDVETLFEFIKSINPPEIIARYFIGFGIIHFVIWGIRYLWIQKRPLSRHVLSKMHGVSDQVGFSLLGVYRAVAGSVFLIFPPILIVEPTYQHLIYLVWAYGFGAACIFMCCLLSMWQVKTSMGARHTPANPYEPSN